MTGILYSTSQAQTLSSFVSPWALPEEESALPPPEDLQDAMVDSIMTTAMTRESHLTRFIEKTPFYLGPAQTGPAKIY